MSSSEGYQLVERIGSGPSGPLYIAETGGQKVVIRQFESTLAPGTSGWSRDRQRFLQAGNADIGLTHPRIVPAVEVIDEAGEAFIAREYVDSETLQSALRTRRFTTNEVTGLLRQIALGVDFAHARGVVHGDLKPSDIFIHPERGARIADFAVSPRGWKLSGDAVSPNLAHPYLSPEHLTPNAPLTAATDQFSLAVIAYQMYTGRLPYEGAGMVLRESILGGSVPLPSDVDRQLPRGLNDPLMRAMDRDPSRRFGSCIEFVTVLESVLLAHPEAAGGRLRPILLWGGLGLLALAAILAGVFALTRPSPKKDVGKIPPTTTTDVAGTSSGSGTPVTPVKSGGTEGGAPPATVTPGTGTTKTGNEAKPPVDKVVREPKTPVKEIPKQPDPVARVPATPGAVTTARVPDPVPVVTGGSIPAAVAVKGFQIEVFSRRNRILSGSSFSAKDPSLGELAHGDLTARVLYEGGTPPKGKLSVEWIVDGVMVDRSNVAVSQPVEYNNEPGRGSYQVNLRLDGKPAGSFNFRITP